jgi:hypothetical protein
MRARAELCLAPLLGALLLGVLPPPAAHSATRTFRATADASVSSSAPSKRLGRSGRLVVARRPRERAYLRFDVALPAGALVSGATLTLSRSGSVRGRPPLQVYAVADATWREQSITYRNAPRFGPRLTTAAGARVRLPARAAHPGSVTLGIATSGRVAQAFRSRESGGAARLTVTFTTQPSGGGGPGKVILAAGDIQRAGTTANATVSLLDSTPYDALLPLGDNQYERGALPDYEAFYAQSWGRPQHKSRSYPVPGNHEGTTRLFSDYCAYFRNGAALDPCPGGQPYYSYDLGSWHMIALNSVTGSIDDAQKAWLRTDLAAHPAKCTLAYWHHPRFTGGTRGNSQLNNIWTDLMAAGVDVVLTGHTHDYQRFAPLDNNQQVDRARGIREFVVGTGGRSVNPSHAVPGQEIHDNTSYGVLRMTLRDGGYDWNFMPAPGQAGTFTDSGGDVCH